SRVQRLQRRKALAETSQDLSKIARHFSKARSLGRARAEMKHFAQAIEAIAGQRDGLGHVIDRDEVQSKGARPRNDTARQLAREKRNQMVEDLEPEDLSGPLMPNDHPPPQHPPRHPPPA